ncbi:aminotransferase-like domain-containing protein [Wenjunlia tyrosinilytica]|uniref:Aminotransferase n=1 Tax=Wenjunlia tyrosinilytica TaxID=1544741 RepID=A0A917ZV57_9ACTN|nr:PLP-dependent aminotransferase family protein [Wenjunlia tyrosinilytica]GGO95613.1 aminotransferase [Wenjunlia tyrosinilytica]
MADHSVLSREAVLEIDRSALHAAVADPVMESVTFLTEVMSKFPDAVSFAPGAPHESFFGSVDIARHIESYVGYLCRERGLTRAQAERRVFQYGATPGQINELVARALRTDEGIDVPPEAVVVTVGCQEAIFITLRALHAGPEDVLLVADPCYVGVVGAARLLGIEIRGVEQPADGFDVAALHRECLAVRAEGKRPRALYLVPDFSNPSGARLDLDARKALLEAAAEEDLVILEDNPYGFTAAQGTRLPTLKALDRNRRVVYLGTFAKVCLPGARVGFAVADQQVRGPGERPRLLAAELAAVKSMVTVNTSPIGQAVIGGMLVESGGSLQAMIREKSEFYQRNLKLLIDALERHFPPDARAREGIHWETPEGGFFLVMTLPFTADDAMVEVSARDFGVLWTPMSHFFVGGSGGLRQIRLSLSYLDDDRMEEGAARLAAFVRSRTETRNCLVTTSG